MKAQEWRGIGQHPIFSRIPYKILYLVLYVNKENMFKGDINTWINDGLRDVLTSHDSKRNDLLYKQEKSQNMFPSWLPYDR